MWFIDTSSREGSKGGWGSRSCFLKKKKTTTATHTYIQRTCGGGGKNHPQLVASRSLSQRGERRGGKINFILIENNQYHGRVCYIVRVATSLASSAQNNRTLEGGFHPSRPTPPASKRPMLQSARERAGLFFFNFPSNWPCQSCQVWKMMNAITQLRRRTVYFMRVCVWVCVFAVKHQFELLSEPHAAEKWIIKQQALAQRNQVKQAGNGNEKKTSNL